MGAGVGAQLRLHRRTRVRVRLRGCLSACVWVWSEGARQSDCVWGVLAAAKVTVVEFLDSIGGVGIDAEAAKKLPFEKLQLG